MFSRGSLGPCFRLIVRDGVNMIIDTNQFGKLEIAYCDCHAAFVYPHGLEKWDRMDYLEEEEPELYVRVIKHLDEEERKIEEREEKED